MTDELPPVRCDDESTWRHKGEKIDLPRLLELVDQNGGSEGLDLHGANLFRLEAGPEALRPHIEAYRREHGAIFEPPWLAKSGGIDLSGAHLERANLWRAHLEAADLQDAQLQNAALQLAHLESATLHWVDLESARLSRAHLQGAALSGARLVKTSLFEAHLEHADLTGAWLDDVRWYGCYLDRTYILRDSLGPAIGDELHAHREKTPEAYLGASEAYLLVKNNFDHIGRYEDASWAYVKEQKMKRMAHYWQWRSRGWKVWREWAAFWRWLRNWAYELLAGYGEWLHMPLLWAAGLSLLAFPLLYWATGALDGHSRAFTSASLSDFDLAGWGDSIIFSLTTFGTLSFAHLQPDGPLARVLAAFEAFAGVLSFALFVFTLGNRMRRS